NRRSLRRLPSGPDKVCSTTSRSTASHSTTIARVSEAPRGEAYYRLAVILGALTAMGPLAIDMYLPALPTIARELHTSESAMQVSLAVYFIGIAFGQAFYGPLSDRWGRKPAL